MVCLWPCVDILACRMESKVAIKEGRGHDGHKIVNRDSRNLGVVR